MAIKVSNGKDTFEVDENRLAEAQKDGFVPTVKVSNGKDMHDVHPNDLGLAVKDGFKLYKPEAPKTAASVSAVRKGIQGMTAGFSDEAAGFVEGAGRILGVEGAGGPMKNMGLAADGPTTDWEVIKDAYKRARDGERSALKKDSKDNPKVSAVAELTGAIVSPVNKLMPKASLAKSGAAIGAITGLGMSDSEDVKGMAVDTAMGAGFGAGAGKLTDVVAAPLISKGAGWATQKASKLKEKMGQSLGETAENLAVKAGGARLVDLWTSAKSGEKGNKVGRYMLDNGQVKAFDTFEDVSAKAGADAKKAGQALDEIYTKAAEVFKGKLDKVGFDPIRDKADILKAAKAELGDSAKAGAALKTLETHLDEIAANHGDAPAQLAKQQYKKEVAEYLPKKRQFLKDKKAYQKQVGKAGDDLDQPVLPGAYDDLQRTTKLERQIELRGKDPSTVRAQGAEPGTQLDLLEMPTGNTEAQRLFARDGEANFGAMGGETADRLGQKTVDALEGPAQLQFLDNNYKQSMGSLAKQGQMEGLELVPRLYQTADEVGVRSSTGQLQMPIAPQAPARPVNPGDVRNPMTPRRTNEIKGAMDNEINYARDPWKKDPAVEKAYMGARKELLRKVEEGLDDLGGGEMVEALRKANKDYGNSAAAKRMADDRIAREKASKFYGLTDSIAGTGAVGYGLLTGDVEGAVLGFAGKKAIEKYGASTLAAAADKVSKQLLRKPEIQALAKQNPKAFAGMVYKLVQQIEEKSPAVMPKAAEQNEAPTKGPKKWASDGFQKVLEHDGTGALADPAVAEQLMKTKKGQRLLIEASGTNNKKALDRIVTQLRTAYMNGDE